MDPGDIDAALQTASALRTLRARFPAGQVTVWQIDSNLAADRAVLEGSVRRLRPVLAARQGDGINVVGRTGRMCRRLQGDQGPGQSKKPPHGLNDRSAPCAGPCAGSRNRRAWG